MLKSLKNNSIKRFYKKNIVKQPGFILDNKVNSLAILLDSDNKAELITEDLAKKLNFDIGKIKIIVYGDFQETATQIINPNYFTEKEFGYKGVIKSNNLKSFVKTEFDVLINYAPQTNLFINMVTLLSKAKFKIGFANIDDRLFNLVVSEDTHNPSVFNSEVKKYLTILNKL